MRAFYIIQTYAQHTQQKTKTNKKIIATASHYDLNHSNLHLILSK